MDKHKWQVLKSVRAIAHRRSRQEHKQYLLLHPSQSMYVKVMRGIVTKRENQRIRKGWFTRLLNWCAWILTGKEGGLI